MKTPLTPAQRAVAALRIKQVLLDGSGEPNRAERRAVTLAARNRARGLRRATDRAVLQERRDARTEGPQ